MKDFDFEKKVINTEMRSWVEKAEKKEVTSEEASKKVDELKVRKNDLEKEEATFKSSEFRAEDKGTKWADIKDSLLSKRAITQNGAGAVNVVNEIVKSFTDKNKLGPVIRKFMAASASSTVPVFAPGLAKPVGGAEGATGVAADSTGVLAGKTLTLYPYVSNVAISRMTLLSTSMDSELPGIFGDAYSSAIDYQVLVGAGTGQNGLGVFTASASGVSTAQDIAQASAGTTKIADLLKLAISVIGNTDNASNCRIVMHPTIFSGILADATAGQDPFKYQLIGMQVMGIPIVLSTHCPTTLTASSYLVVGGDFSKYAMAYASELSIDKINVVGTDNITAQAVSYMQFSPILGSAFYRLKTV